jgi:tetratricopeptide (TPR) repeat protein
LGPLADLLLQSHSHRIQGACLDLMEQFGTSISLSGMRADKWMAKLGEEIEGYDRICQIMGERFLAYAFMLGIQIKTLSMDPRYPVNTMVEFSVNDERVQTLTLGEFRVRTVQSLLSQKRHPTTPSLPLTLENAAPIIGGKNLLVAPLFGISLNYLILADIDSSSPRAIVGYISEDDFAFIDLDDFDELLQKKIRKDLSAAEQEPFKIDPNIVAQAKDAFANNDIDAVLDLLQSWPGLLTILSKTPTGRALEETQRVTIGEGSTVLGAAFELRDRNDLAESIYRLGLQFVREGPVAAQLFFRLGRIYDIGDRYAEAIALFRRAELLGVGKEEVLPYLGRAFLKSGKIIPGLALLEHATAQGFNTSEFEADLREAREALEHSGQPWDIPLLAPRANGCRH